MEVSTFELLTKRIAPVPPTSATVSRRVVQGYFLTITNLEDKDFTYRLDFHISKPDPVDPDRTLAGNTKVFYDIAGANNELTLFPTGAAATATIFSVTFRLPAKQTASLQLLPDVTNPALIANPNPDLEVRGFVRLRLPALFGGFPGPLFKPQSDTPVNVLLNPEIRGTFLPNGFPGGDAADFDQINYPLALASGKGLNSVDPEKGILIPFPTDLVAELAEQLPLRDRPVIDFAALSETERAEALVDLLAQVDPSEENVRNISDLLSKLNVPIQMGLARS